MPPDDVALVIEEVNAFIVGTGDNLEVTGSINISHTEREQAGIKGLAPCFLEITTRMFLVFVVHQGYQLFTFSCYEKLDTSILIDISS